jgi:hypothetical protein
MPRRKLVGLFIRFTILDQLLKVQTVKYADFTDKSPDDAEWRVNPQVKCNNVEMYSKYLSCHLCPSEAIELARNLLDKARLIIDEDLEDAAVHLWSDSKQTPDTLLCGIVPVVRRRVRKKRGSTATDNRP